MKVYSFQVKKCGDAACNICKPPNLPRDIFSQLKWIPDPIPDSDGHYKQFSTCLYGTKTSEDYCPSLKQKKQAQEDTSICFKLEACKECGYDATV